MALLKWWRVIIVNNFKTGQIPAYISSKSVCTFRWTAAVYSYFVIAVVYILYCMKWLESCTTGNWSNFTQPNFKGHQWPCDLVDPLKIWQEIRIDILKYEILQGRLSFSSHITQVYLYEVHCHLYPHSSWYSSPLESCNITTVTLKHRYLLIMLSLLSSVISRDEPTIALSLATYKQWHHPHI